MSFPNSHPPLCSLSCSNLICCPNCNSFVLKKKSNAASLTLTFLCTPDLKLQLLMGVLLAAQTGTYAETKSSSSPQSLTSPPPIMSVSHSSASVYKVPWHFLLPHGVYTTQCCQLYLRLPPLPSLLSISPAFSPTQLQNLPRPEQMQIEGFLIHFHPVVHPPHSCQDGPLTQKP